MSNAPWTPGPWEMIVDDTGGQFSGWPSVVAPEDVDATVVHRAGFKQEFWGDWSQRQALANARLIAEAPAMAEALEAFAHCAEMDGHMDDPLVVNARAILARINGGTP